MAKKEKSELTVKDEPYEISPFREMERYFDEVFRHPFSLLRHPMWPQFRFPERNDLSPTVDIFEDGDEVVVKAEIPGIKKSDLKVDITENSLTISGEKKQENQVDRHDYHRVECSYGSFRRSFRLPDNVISDQARATFKDGILTIRMPKSDKSKKKRITID